MQPSGARFGRLIPGKKFQTWNQEKFSRAVAHVFENGDLAKSMKINWHVKQVLNVWCSHMRKKKARSTISRKSMTNKRVRDSAESVARWVGMFGSTGVVNVFVDVVARKYKSESLRRNFLASFGALI